MSGEFAGIPSAFDAEGDDEPAELPMGLLEESVWSDDWLESLDIPTVVVPFVTVGGGLGSLAMVQYLRTAGVPSSDIRILSATSLPYETYKRLAETSQIGPRDTLRSGSDATMDNIWGWPGYALRQALADRSIRPLWTVLTEPILSEYFNPRAQELYDSVDREARRLEWPSMLSRGQVRMVRRRMDGGYFVVQVVDDGSSRRAIAYRATYVHVAVGYPSLRFLPDLQEYRTRHRDYFHVVNAYEPHEHVYQRLRSAPGTVMVRGSGIVASRILQRLLDDRERHGAQTQIFHLFRTYVPGPQGPRTFRRDGGDGFSYGPFNFPRAAFGGQFKMKLDRMDGRHRIELIKAMGGTSTPRRRDWERQIEEGARGGWYRQYVGEVRDVQPASDGHIVTCIRGADGRGVEVTADFIIDATGLEGDIRDHVLLRDILNHTGAYANPLGRLDVEPSFELRGTRNTPGRLYAAGAIALGGYYAPVDSFVGVQYAALSICDDLARLGFCRRIGARRSVSQWWRWMRNQPP